MCFEERNLGPKTYIDKDAKGDPEKDAEDKVDRPVGKGAREGNEPDQGKEDAERRNDFGVNEAPLGAARALVVVEVLAVDTGDNGGEDELRAAQDQANKTVDGHCEMRFDE